MELEQSKGLKLSGRQFDVLCSILRAADDPEERGREIGAMDNRDVLKLIGVRNF